MTKREIAFVLSLSATVILPIFLWFLFFLKDPSIILRIVLIMPIMIAVLLFMRRQGASKSREIIGGIIILIMGIVIGMLVFLPVLIMGIRGMLAFLPVEIRVKMSFFSLIPAVMAITGGYLGIQGAREGEVKKRQYSKASIFRISLMGFISVLIPIFILFLSIIVGMKEVVIDASVIIIFGVVPPLFLVISIILNAISTVVIGRKEIITEKRIKILIIATWCIIGLLLISLFFVLFMYFVFH